MTLKGQRNHYNVKVLDGIWCNSLLERKNSIPPLLRNEWLFTMAHIETLDCYRCRAPVAVLQDEVCIRCAESIEPPLSCWRGCSCPANRAHHP